jgi:hypothetical protein
MERDIQGGKEMRQLTKKQKRLLLEEWNRLKQTGIEYPCIEDIPHDTYEMIDSINPCEIYYQNVNSLFWDLRFQE